MNASFAAVLTGDIVNSRNMPQDHVEAGLQCLRETSQTYQDDVIWFTEDLNILFTQHRGDGWQVYVSDARLAVDLALKMQTALKAHEFELSTKLAIGFGAATIPDGNLALAYGDAFIRSGDALDELPKGQLMHIDQTIGPAGPASIAMLDLHLQSWTKAQAEAVFYKIGDPLLGISDDHIATKLNVSRQAIQARLSSIGFRSIERALSDLKHAIAKESE